jgi:3-deoxy-D-manno-octulosonate 8-phosphate phosphatase (KDO 8-P phosphatase)
MMNDELLSKAARIKLLLTDCDGVLTDGGVYYSDMGEAMKKFNIRDGMGVERLRDIVQVETGIITGETSLSVTMRAAKLKIKELHLGTKDKPAVLKKIIEKKQLQPNDIAYIGDDVNDIAVMKMCGLTACPADALPQVKEIANYICEKKGGEGAFREFAELIISAKPTQNF